jgi:hypothetical protein
MKTKLMLLSLMLISTLSFSQTIIRVKSGEKIQNIIDDIKNPSGMILLLDAGSFEGFTAYKTVSIIGSGFFNGNNSSTITGNVEFSSNNNSKSDNSFMTGCNVERIIINRNNITVSKCRAFGGSDGIIIGGTNDKILNCLVDNSITFDHTASAFKVSNCIILGLIGTSSLSTTITGKIVFNTIGNNSYCNPLSFAGGHNKPIEISNNIFISATTCDNRDGRHNFVTNLYSKFNNNILRKGNYQSTDVTNKFLTDMSPIFANAGSSDAQYLLATNSPAKGAGEGGTDCGAFGGTEPYIIGGLPTGPVIIDLQVPSTARQNETIQIKLKAKVQN